MIVQATLEEIQARSEDYYKDRYGNPYPFHKKLLWETMDVLKPATILPILRDMDFPFIEKEWLKAIERYIGFVLIHGSVPCGYVLNRYLAKMRTPDYQDLTFDNSDYSKRIKEYIPEVMWFIKTYEDEVPQIKSYLDDEEDVDGINS